MTYEESFNEQILHGVNEGKHTNWFHFMHFPHLSTTLNVIMKITQNVDVDSYTLDILS